MARTIELKLAENSVCKLLYYGANQVVSPFEGILYYIFYSMPTGAGQQLCTLDINILVTMAKTTLQGTCLPVKIPASVF